MADSKQYRLTNEEPGPRGVDTAAHGLVMVQPALPGTESSTVATLTDDEAKAAERQGLSLEEVDVGSTGIISTDNIPAAGHIDINAPDAGEKLKAGKAKGRGKAKADEKAEDKADEKA